MRRVCQKPGCSGWIMLGLALLAVYEVQCAKPQKAAVEEVDGDHARTLPLLFSSLVGKRDGDRVKGYLVFQGSEKGDRLIITFDLDLGPPIRLASGRFLNRQAGKMFIGNVEASTLDFQAGQSGGMSLGGRFVLISDNGTLLYRVFLPPKLFGAAYR